MVWVCPPRVPVLETWFPVWQCERWWNPLRGWAYWKVIRSWDHRPQKGLMLVSRSELIPKRVGCSKRASLMPDCLWLGAHHGISSSHTCYHEVFTRDWNKKAAQSCPFSPQIGANKILHPIKFLISWCFVKAIENGVTQRARKLLYITCLKSVCPVINKQIRALTDIWGFVLMMV
jgi:hypothetical protein